MAILAEGTIPATPEIIYRVGQSVGDKTTFETGVIDFDRITLDKITFFNNIQTQQTVILSMKRKSGGFRKLRQFQLKINESGEYLQAGELLPLRAGDELEAETTTADAVDFVVCGTLV